MAEGATAINAVAMGVMAPEAAAEGGPTVPINREQGGLITVGTISTSTSSIVQQPEDPIQETTTSTAATE